MRKTIFLLLTLVFSSVSSLPAQSIKKLSGVVLEQDGTPIQNVLIKLSQIQKSTLTDNDGHFIFLLDSGIYNLNFSHVRFQDTYREVSVPTVKDLQVVLLEKTSILDDVKVQEKSIDILSDQHITKLEAKNVLNLPTATGDFNNVLATLPGVYSNNELSSTYSVRGGNYDENLVYVNGIKIYRPQIVSAGRQEGLSFINPDLVRGIEFSPGGWRARYGDKLSSMLNVTYREPTDFEGSINASMLGGSIYVGGRSKNQSTSYATGIRHKNSRYLLGTLEVEGEYFPRFTDFQSYFVHRLSSKTKISLLGAAAFNNYETIPTIQESTFGTSQETLRLRIGFDGREKLNYQTYQLAGQVKHSLNDNFIANLTLSGIQSSERENFDLEAGYRLCEIAATPGTDQFNDCIAERGLGTSYRHGRNKLTAQILNVEQRNEVYINNDLLEFGLNWDYEILNDQLQEYTFTDSADFVQIERSVDNSFDINSHKIAAFGQYTLINQDSTDIINIGLRFNYWTYSQQLLTSPRMQYVHVFRGLTTNAIRMSFGIYSQHPFYRELRDRSGNINPIVKAQKSVHFNLGWDRYFKMWGRPFKMSIDGYNKYLWDVNLYDIDNVKIRYYADNEAVAEVYGVDLRLNGEFVEGAESWFSIGYLNAKEAVNDTSSFVRRPTDQRINLGIFYQDHIPNDPSIRVSLNMLYGTGLPFGPSNNDRLRASFIGDSYFRVDVGFTKHFQLVKVKKLMPKKIIIGLEVLNLLATDNAISYTWIQDFQSNNYAIPNSLSNRFINLRVMGKF
ncbi:TonB-dependent receptor [Reichenbachiella versicolor]|uniref:TonB-dependent receptor n=1 Tax=Reichenbachiella versicolor TaxID=1821036 RepID=UPI000D6E1768|nr:TonB-dependent receptor [Reichenbachiella versicolor]